MFGWSEASSVFIWSIQAFWLVAFAAAERIAISPASPICSAIMSTCTLAMPSAVAWLMNRSRHSGLVSESKVTTLVPASRASFSASQIASLSLAETIRAATPCWAAVLMNGTCASGLAVSGPTCWYFPPHDSTASLPALSLVSKYGFPRFLGRNVKVPLTSPPPPPPLDESPPLSLSLPQADSASPATSATAASTDSRLFRSFMVGAFHRCWWMRDPVLWRRHAGAREDGVPHLSPGPPTRAPGREDW